MVGSATERRKRHFGGDECGKAAARLSAVDKWGWLEGGAVTKMAKANKIVILE